MNDFTKEELENIYSCVSDLSHGALCDEDQELLDKIQSMIDNYCEHKPIKEAYVYVEVCEKCNRVLKQVDDL